MMKPPLLPVVYIPFELRSLTSVPSAFVFPFPEPDVYSEKLSASGYDLSSRNVEPSTGDAAENISWKKTFSRHSLS
jgi:hypothetical protein